MNKKILLLVLPFLAFIVLSGCTARPFCGNKACELGEKEPESPFYCRLDCAEKPAAGTATGEQAVEKPAGEAAPAEEQAAEEQPSVEQTPEEAIKETPTTPTPTQPAAGASGTTGGTATGGVNGINQPPTTQQPPVQQPTQPQPVTPTPQPPTARINADKTSGTAALTVNFNGTGSTAAAGTIVKYEWDFENNGLFDANSPTTAKSFNSPGIYSVILKVTDSNGLTDTETIIILVSQAAQPPTARIGTDKNSGNAPVTVNFNAANSTAANGATITKYEWDFTNDGVFDSNGSTASYSFSNDGTFANVLKVTDSKGLTDTETIIITVSAAQQQVYKQTRKTCSNPDTTCGLMNVIARLYNYCWDYDCSGTTLPLYPKLSQPQKPADFWADITNAPLASGNVHVMVVFLYTISQMPEDKIAVFKAGEANTDSFNYAAKWFEDQAIKYGVNLNVTVHFTDMQFMVPDEYVIHTYQESISKNITKYVKENLGYDANYDVIVPLYYSPEYFSFANHVSANDAFELFANGAGLYPSSETFAHELAHLFGATDKGTCWYDTSSADCIYAKQNGIGCWIESDNPSEKGKDLMCHRVPFYEGGSWWFRNPPLNELIVIDATVKEFGWYDFDSDGILEVNDPCRYQFVQGPC